ncbi:MAG: methyltransferase [Candidatus Omnitrophota bacterium]
MKKILKKLMPKGLRSLLKAGQHRLCCHPPLGWVCFGSLRRTEPVSRVFGLNRGLPIDRYYIRDFLKKQSADIKGHVLEIENSDYTDQFGGDKVISSDVLHAVTGNPRATIIGNLTTGENIPKDAYDCMIITQTLHCIYDMKAAVKNIYHALAKGGVVLASLPGISQISRYDMDRWGDYWRFTTLSARRLFEEVFEPGNIIIEACGNVLSSAAFLYGLAAEELKKKELDYRDPDYEQVITVRAVK